jgi:hypothetical protein
MKTILTLLFFLFQTSLFANKIDDLKSDIDVQKFLKKKVRNLKDFYVVSIEDLYISENGRKIADSLKVKTWEKVDFDNNGETDLLVNGIWDGRNNLIAIMANGNKFYFHSFNKGLITKQFFPKIETINNITTLSLFEICEFCLEKELTNKKLIFKYGSFIEPNYNAKKYNIEKIEYSTTMCFGTCPVFKLMINSNKSITYIAEQYNDLQGEFNSIIKTEDYNSIIDLLNYIDFPSLKNNYEVNWTDDQACELRITYNNGKTKIISDYGKIGTYGLIRIYNKMFRLRGIQDWNEK